MFAMNAKQAEQRELEQHDMIQAEIAKLIAETSKINNENEWYPFFGGVVATLAIFAVVKIFL